MPRSPSAGVPRPQTAAPKPRKGYVRSEVLLPALSYQINEHPQEPSVRILALLTPDGPVTVTLHKDAVSQLGSALLVDAQKTGDAPSE